MKCKAYDFYDVGAAGTRKMQLSTFLRENIEPILREWEAFAVTIHVDPAGRNALRDHAEAMLIAIAADMQTAQTATEQQAKSRGRRRRDPDKGDSAAETHAEDRLGLGFTLDQVVAEYRALRASVIRLWTREMRNPGQDELDELTRFNEAIDEALSESVSRYTSRVERARGLLLGALGHDLRNPLGAILQWAHLLLRDDVAERVHTNAAARIITSGNRMKGMVSDLLDFARTQLGDPLPLTPASMDLGDVCRATLDEMAVLYPDHPLKLESEGDLNGTWDRARIGQMLSNLTGNAAQHGARGAPIVISARARKDEIRISVHNKGTPIPLNLRRRIFEPLGRGPEESTRSDSGQVSLGLGLYIACQIAKAHGGDLELTASDEAGTTFTAILPRHCSVEAHRAPQLHA